MPNSVVVIDKKSNWTPWIVAGGVAAAGVGLYLWTQKRQEEGMPSGIKITSYQNLRSGVVATPSKALLVEPGDGVRVNFEFSYQGPPQVVAYHAAFYYQVSGGPVDERCRPIDSVTNVPDSPSVQVVKLSADLTVCPGSIFTPLEGMPPGNKFGLFVKTDPGSAKGYQLPNVIDVREPAEVDFDIARPTAAPFEAPPGPVTITVPVTSRSTLVNTVTIKCLVYEGSILPGAGVLLWTSPAKTVTISPGQTVNVQFVYNSVQRDATRRDVGVEVYLEGTKVADGEWDDVFYVKATVEPAFSDLEIIGVTSPVVIGGTCQVTCRWMYQGPATTKTLYAAIGNWRGINWPADIGLFDEILKSQVTINLPASDVPIERASAVVIPITSTINPDGSPYDVYAKIVGEIYSPRWDNALTVTPRYVSFLMSINPDGAVAAFPGADRWRADYWDPQAQRFVGDGQWHYLSIWPGNDIAFDHVAPGGYLAVFLWDTANGISEQFTSPEWTAEDGHDYEYDPLYNQIYEI